MCGGGGESTVWGWILTICSDRSDSHAVLHPTVRRSVVRDPGKKAGMLIKCEGWGGGEGVKCETDRNDPIWCGRPVIAVVHAKLFIVVFVLIFPVRRCCVQDAEGSCEGDFCK